MNQVKYLHMQSDIVEIGKKVAELDLTQFISKISLAESVGPIADPTLYIKAQKNLSAIKKLAESLLPVQVAIEELRLSVIKTQSTKEHPNLFVVKPPEDYL